MLLGRKMKLEILNNDQRNEASALFDASPWNESAPDI
jgi:hypothetical protein